MKEQVKNKISQGSVLLALPILAVLVAVISFVLFRNDFNLKFNNPPEADKATVATSDKVKLVYAVHWSEKFQTDGIYEGDSLKVKGLKQYLDEYSKLNPNIEFEIQVIAYNDYADKLKILSDSGMSPDIYQIYSPWGVSYVQEGILDKPPKDLIEDIKKNYISTAGATINGEIWGIPTEINDYSLLYNKNLFREAGVVDAKGRPDYPKTWNDLVSKAIKLTKKDGDGNITQYGIAFLKGNDWQVVDPFLSLLFSNGGKYLSDDYKKALFNSPQGVAALEAELELFEKGATDTNGNFFDFGKGKVAMVIAPPWTKAGFKASFGDSFESTVGVAPFPYLTKPAVLQYSWFMGVMSKSQHKEEAWKFLKWFSSELNPPIIGTTRYGDLLAENIGAIPSRKVDFDGHKKFLKDFFTSVYLDQMKYGVAEPNVAESNNIKASLMKEIESAWSGQKTAKEALDSAAVSIDKILGHYYSR